MCLPFLVSPSLLLNRGNDLQEFFWPIIEYTKNSLGDHGELPLWYSNILSGTPLLPDPQAMLFYLPNTIFIFLPIGAGFITSIVLHIVVGGVGMYMLVLKGLSLKSRSALLAGLLYVTAPRLSAYLEAGHFGLITSWAYLPWILFYSLEVARKPRLTTSLVLALLMATVFLLHNITFVVIGFFSAGLFTLVAFQAKTMKRAFFYYFLTSVLTFGFSAIVLIPQLLWSPETTRFLLLKNPEVYPIWSGGLDFVKAVFVPWWGGAGALQSVETEKWLTLGTGVSLLAFLGLLRLPRKLRLLVCLAFVVVLVVTLNNISPARDVLVSMSWYRLMRVASRMWVVVTLLGIVLAAYGAEKIKYFKLVALVLVVESLVLSWTYTARDFKKNSYVSAQILNYLASDAEQMRVFCVARCVSQRDAIFYDIELVEGYSTLTQSNYMSAIVGYTNFFWDYYSLAIPPLGSDKATEFKPNLELLGVNNVKYLILETRRDIDGAYLVFDDGHFFVYLNKYFKPRANVRILYYSPNRIIFDTSELSSGDSVLLRDTYSPGWTAYDSVGEALSVQETPDHHRSIGLINNTDRIVLVYEPSGYKLGSRVTKITLISVLVYLFLSRIKWRQ